MSILKFKKPDPKLPIVYGNYSPAMGLQGNYAYTFSMDPRTAQGNFAAQLITVPITVDPDATIIGWANNGLVNVVNLPLSQYEVDLACRIIVSSLDGTEQAGIETFMEVVPAGQSSAFLDLTDATPDAIQGTDLTVSIGFSDSEIVTAAGGTFSVGINVTVSYD